MHELLDRRKSHIRVAMFIGGVAMAAAAYGLEYYSSVINYPYNSGGRPLDAWPAFMLVPFAIGILVAAIAGFATLLVECGLPRLHHALFAVEGFERASQDRFILALERPADDDAMRPGARFLSRRRRYGLARGRRMTRRLAMAAALAAAGFTLAACDLSMTQQRKLTTYAPTSLWPDGSSARPLPADVVAQGDAARAAEAKTALPVTAALLARGRERFGIFCAPCHGLAGDGDGIIVAHGFPAPPSYHIDRLLAAPAQHFYDVITNGYGVMFSYADRVDPHDRWAIVAYIRALQLSRRATVAEMPDAAEHIR